jgi:hypothetical protein
MSFALPESLEEWNVSTARAGFITLGPPEEFAGVTAWGADLLLEFVQGNLPNRVPIVVELVLSGQPTADGFVPVVMAVSAPRRIGTPQRVFVEVTLCDGLSASGRSEEPKERKERGGFT